MIALGAVVIVTVALVAGGLWFQRWITQQRTRAIADVAAAQGWSFAPTDAFGCAETPFHVFERGHGRKTTNVCSLQDSDGTAVRVFDYTFTEGSGRSSSTYNHSCCLFDDRGRFPLLTIERESKFAGVLGAIGAGDLQFESHEFNRSFHVTSEDPRFASAVIDAPMMQFLLADFGATMHISLHQRYVIVWCQRIAAVELPAFVQYAKSFRARIPTVARELYPDQ